MKPSLYIDPSGVIRYNLFPEEPKRDYSDRHVTEFLFKIAWREYEQALQAAKDSAVPLDNNYLNAKELFDCMTKYTPAVNLHQWLSEHKGEIIPLPDNYSVEVKEKCNYSEGCGTVDCKCEKVAILTPVEKFSLMQDTPTVATDHTEIRLDRLGNTVELVLQRESQEELWNDVDNNYIKWNDQEIKLSDLLRDFQLVRK
jgi:hypothetical protein